MKKVLVTLIVLLFGLSTFAGEKEDALEFFNHFVSVYNSYNSAELLKLYSSNAKIIEQVIYNEKPESAVSFSIGDYRTRIESTLKDSKIHKYKKTYKDISVEKVSNGYKINAKTKCSAYDSYTKTYIIVHKQSNNKWLIVEEMVPLTMNIDFGPQK